MSDDVRQYATMLAVTPQLIEDMKFDIVGYVAANLVRQLHMEMEVDEVRALLGTFRITRYDSGFWFDNPRTFWQRLFRREATQTWVPTVAFRATVDTEPNPS